MFDNTWEIKLVHEYKVEQMNRELEYKRAALERVKLRRRHLRYYILVKLGRHIKSLGSDLEVKYEKKIKQRACA